MLTATPSAHAHLMNTGFGPFYDGLTHLFVTPEDLLPVIALALLAGLRGPRFGRAVDLVPLNPRKLHLGSLTAGSEPVSVRRCDHRHDGVTTRSVDFPYRPLFTRTNLKALLER
jgi:hypothetical protein